MNFTIPRNNNSELLLYIWKIIDLPSISFNDLIYNISFKLFLLSPNEASSLINDCIKDKFLIEDNKGGFQLSAPLKQVLERWQERRKTVIAEKMETAKKITKITNNIYQNQATVFSVLIKQVVDKQTLNRAATISNSNFKLKEFNPEKGLILSTIKGSEEDPYIIEIDINKKSLKHNCHDFETRRSLNKKFCKHLTKLFLWLKDENKEVEFFLKDIVENIEEWTFTS
ncbi:MAG: hypothetical protein ACFE8N_05775 [Promethearchaeota archaeon]